MKKVEEIANKYADHVLADHLAQEIKSYAKQHAIKFLKNHLLKMGWLGEATAKDFYDEWRNK